jgi:small subunit ribosomal protein S20
MANIKSQIKRNRQNEERRVRNKSARSRLRTRVRRFEEALAEGDVDTAEELYRIAARDLDKAAGKGIIHKNKAANKKARLAARLNRST